nr:MAG TPA: hypothetical protein [Caudoviricetes sp.]
MSPTLHYHRGRRSSARPPCQPVCAVYTRLQFSGWPTQRRNEATKVLLYKKKLPTQRSRREATRISAKLQRLCGSNLLLYIRRTY